MGYLTTLTFRNDSYSDIKKNKNRLHKIVLDAMNGIQIRQGRDYDNIGSSANGVIIQKPRHADDHTLYIHAGNTVIDVYEAESERVIETFIKEMEYHLKRLKEKNKNIKNK